MPDTGYTTLFSPQGADYFLSYFTDANPFLSKYTEDLRKRRFPMYRE
jgi:hypothetical protein